MAHPRPRDPVAAPNLLDLVPLGAQAEAAVFRDASGVSQRTVAGRGHLGRTFLGRMMRKPQRDRGLQEILLILVQDLAREATDLHVFHVGEVRQRYAGRRGASEPLSGSSTTLRLPLHLETHRI